MFNALDELKEYKVPHRRQELRAVSDALDKVKNYKLPFMSVEVIWIALPTGVRKTDFWHTQSDNLSDAHCSWCHLSVFCVA